jgi:hypothetical protein
MFSYDDSINTPGIVHRLHETRNPEGGRPDGEGMRNLENAECRMPSRFPVSGFRIPTSALRVGVPLRLDIRDAHSQSPRVFNSSRR